MDFTETRFRSLVKTIVWRVVATAITWVCIYIFTGQLRESVRITVVAAIAGMVAYYAYERIWIGIRWGKVIRK